MNAEVRNGVSAAATKTNADADAVRDSLATLETGSKGTEGIGALTLSCAKRPGICVPDRHVATLKKHGLHVKSLSTFYFDFECD